MTTTHPILFSGPMVRAILDGRKGQTRRVIKPQPQEFSLRPSDVSVAPYCTGNPELGMAYYWMSGGLWNSTSKFFPRYKEGDILWVRETWKHIFPEANGPIEYRANHGEGAKVTGGWRPSIFMPKQVCRLFLKATRVRAERVADISREDSIAEGLACLTKDKADVAYAWKDDDNHGHGTATGAFRGLWDSINAKRGFGWEVNPWVWVYTFEQVERPEGECGKIMKT